MGSGGRKLCAVCRRRAWNVRCRSARPAVATQLPYPLLFNIISVQLRCSVDRGATGAGDCCTLDRQAAGSWEFSLYSLHSIGAPRSPTNASTRLPLARAAGCCSAAQGLVHVRCDPVKLPKGRIALPGCWGSPPTRHCRCRCCSCRHSMCPLPLACMQLCLAANMRRKRAPLLLLLLASIAAVQHASAAGAGLSAEDATSHLHASCSHSCTHWPLHPGSRIPHSPTSPHLHASPASCRLQSARCVWIESYSPVNWLPGWATRHTRAAA